MKINRNIVIENRQTRSFLADEYIPDGQQKYPLLIFVHGFKGYKDWGAWDAMCQELCKEGFVVVKFNFSFNGTTLDNPTEFTDLEAFGRNTFTKELSDVAKVIEYFSANDYVDGKNISLIGHSRGGGIAILGASRNQYVKNIITLASVSDFGARFPPDNQLQVWKKMGVIYQENKRTGQKMPLYYDFYEDYEQNREILHIASAVKSITIPFLIIHGTDDEAVHLNEAQNLQKWNPTSELFVIEGANHVFGAKEPWESDMLPIDLSIAIEKIKSFLK